MTDANEAVVEEAIAPPAVASAALSLLATWSVDEAKVLSDWCEEQRFVPLCRLLRDRDVRGRPKNPRRLILQLESLCELFGMRIDPITPGQPNEWARTPDEADYSEIEALSLDTVPLSAGQTITLRQQIMVSTRVLELRVNETAEKHIRIDQIMANRSTMIMGDRVRADEWNRFGRWGFRDMYPGSMFEVTITNSADHEVEVSITCRVRAFYGHGSM